MNNEVTVEVKEEKIDNVRVVMGRLIKVKNTKKAKLSNAKNVYYAASVFEGATTPVNANITQLIANTQDNQGNILI